MATLNGVEFKILTIEWATSENNIVQNILGSDTVVVHSQGYRTDPVKIRGRVQREDEFDNFQEEFYSGGILTFIKEPSSGKQYQVYALGNIRLEDPSNNEFGTGMIFNCLIQLKYPYKESTLLTTRSKTITTQNQEWSADDDSKDIETDGNVDAVPDIQVIGVAAETLHIHITQGSGYGESAVITDFGQTFTTTTDMNNITKICITFGGSCSPGTFTLEIWDSFAKNTSYGSESGNAYSSGTETTVTFDPIISLSPSTQYYMHIHIDSGTAHSRYTTSSVYSGGNYYNWASQGAYDLFCKIYYGKNAKDIEIYNTIDTTVKNRICNDILDTAIHRINVDGTGTINFDDDFTSNKYIYNSTADNITYDDTNDKLDIADDGYIYWKKDTKLPINGIPTLTSKIDITSGIPTIQISIDASTWYDIDTALVDDVETVYPLDSDGNLSLVGKTIFYFRMDCVKAAPATASIKYFELDINIHTIYAKNPKITKGSTPSTFRCDQDPDSGMGCIIALIFRDRWWV